MTSLAAVSRMNSNIEPGMEADAPLTFTGERFLPECKGEIWLEHWHRYLFAQGYVDGLRVLDAACGEGYGSHILSARARAVVGIDVSPQAVAHARRRYAETSNLAFSEGRCDRLEFPDASFDAVVSFETIEHLAEQVETLAEFRRVLRPGGLLIISTPNRKTYSDERNYQNEYHVREFYRAEFEAFLKPHFAEVHWFGQKIMMHSVIWPEHVAAVGARVDIEGERESNLIPYEPLYFIAVCGDALPDRQITILGEAGEWLVRHYEDGMRKMIQLDRILHEREAAFTQRGERLDQIEACLADLKMELERRRTLTWWAGVPVRRLKGWLAGLSRRGGG